MKTRNFPLAVLCGTLAVTSAHTAEPVAAETSNSDDLAKQLANPVASLISAPIEIHESH